MAPATPVTRGPIITALLYAAAGAIGFGGKYADANQQQRRAAEILRFTPRSHGGSTSSHYPSLAQRRARRKFERQNRRRAQRLRRHVKCVHGGCSMKALRTARNRARVSGLPF